VRELLPADAVVRFGDTLHLRYEPGGAQRLASDLAARGVDSETIEPTIEDVFVAFTSSESETP
jgi:hypothetical protein